MKVYVTYALAVAMMVASVGCKSPGGASAVKDDSTPGVGDSAEAGQTTYAGTLFVGNPNNDSAPPFSLQPDQTEPYSYSLDLSQLPQSRITQIQGMNAQHVTVTGKLTKVKDPSVPWGYDYTITVKTLTASSDAAPTAGDAAEAGQTSYAGTLFVGNPNDDSAPPFSLQPDQTEPYSYSLDLSQLPQSMIAQIQGMNAQHVTVTGKLTKVKDPSVPWGYDYTITVKTLTAS